MEKKEIKVYTNFNGIEKNETFLAIKDEFVIKYTDLENNKMVIDTSNDIIRKENQDYLIEIYLQDNIIDITIKKFRRKINKGIKTLLIEKRKKAYLIRYQLLDEKEINEYYVNF